MLDAVAALDGEGEVARARLADAHHEGALVLVREKLLRVCAGDAAVVPAVGLHLDVVRRDQAWKKKLRIKERIWESLSRDTFHLQILQKESQFSRIFKLNTDSAMSMARHLYLFRTLKGP